MLVRNRVCPSEASKVKLFHHMFWSAQFRFSLGQRNPSLTSFKANVVCTFESEIACGPGGAVVPRLAGVGCAVVPAGEMATRASRAIMKCAFSLILR